MNKESKTDSFEEKIRNTIKAGIPQHRQEFKNLLNKRMAEQTLMQSQKKEGFKSIKLKPARTIAFSIVLIVIVMTFAIGPKNIYAAIQNLLRYIPGIGFVEVNRVLADQVTVERDGINLTVQEMVVNEEETVLIYYVDNLPMEKYFDYIQQNNLDESAPSPLSEITYKLRVENGEVIEGQMISGHTTNKQDGTDWTGKVVFPALSPNITQVQFLMNVLPNMYKGMAPEDWAVSVSLKYSDEVSEPSFVYQPAYTVVATEENEPSQADKDNETETMLELKDDISLLLNAVSINEDKIALEISINWGIENWYGANVMDIYGFSDATRRDGVLPHYLSLVDANGTEVLLENNESSGGGTPEKSRKFTFIGDIAGLELVNPLTLELHGVNITASMVDEEIPTVEFTPTSELFPGECEEISQSVTVYDSQVDFMKVCSVENPETASHGGGGGGGTEPTPQPPIQYGLELHIELPQNIFDVSVADLNCLANTDEQIDNCGAGYGKPGGENVRINGTLYFEKPDWPLEYKIMNTDFFLQGPWVIQFEIQGLEQ